MSPRHYLSPGFETLRLEGALLLPDVLEKAALGSASRQSDPDYQIPKGFSQPEEIGRAFRIARAQWKAFRASFERTDLDAATATRAFVEEFLRDALGYTAIRATPPVAVGDRRFPIGAFAARGVPVVVAAHRLDLDEPDAAFATEGGSARRKSPFQLLQEFLNAAPDCRWGLVTNGCRIRLARDAATLTRPSFVEFDLEAVLADARYPDFAALWRLLHASRAGREGDCVWESWRSDGQREGARAREGLRTGVEAALVRFGEGFLRHPANEALRRALITGTLGRYRYFEELLRLVYRFIFLFAVEERGLLHPEDPSPQAAAARRVYEEGYSARRLRDRCLRRAARDGHDDLWQAQTIVFRALAAGEPRLALPALGGLFAPDQCPYLDSASLSNGALLEAMRGLRWSAANGTVAPVDYRNMGPEELGSVYESLLELVPEPDPHARSFGFAGMDGDGDTKGNARKTTGSYYTPDSLVQELIKSALDPVIEARIAAQPDRPTEALLGITVLDPACGSGHFLLAAARRLAEKLAALRAPEGAVSAPDYRHALREVVTHCIYGVDRNPMALELARVALWLEGFEEGRPLGFLDHHLVCGDALIGITDLAQLTHGIPDAAFKALSGDDKAICKALAKENKEGLKAFAKRKADPNLSLALERDGLLAERAALEAMPDATLVEQAAKQAAYQSYSRHERQSRLRQAADLFAGAFLVRKSSAQSLEHTPTSRNLYFALFTETAPEDLRQVKQVERLAEAARVACEARVLHWPLTFLQVFQKGGFDCVLGNPPWEVSQLAEVEYFATRAPEIARLAGDARKRAIADLPDTDERLWLQYVADKRLLDASNTFFRESGRFPLTAVGKINTYPLFAETIDQLIGERGRAGFIVPSGIATDDSTKRYFGHVVSERRLISLSGFDNAKKIFPAVHPDTPFSLVTLGQSADQVQLVHYVVEIGELHDERRRFTLGPADFRVINPNTLTCPIFRSQKDAELTKQIYARVPVLIREVSAGGGEVNPWGLVFSQGLFNMTSDSHLFLREPAGDRLPLYEAKMIHQFDHRWASYRSEGGEDVADDVSLRDKQNPAFTVRPRYWVEACEVDLRAAALPKALVAALRERDTAAIRKTLAELPESFGVPSHLRTSLADTHAALEFAEELLERATPRWFLGFRDITNATNERTVIASILPRAGVGNNLPLMQLESSVGRHAAGLLANLSSLVLDFVARHKVGGVHLNFFIAKQLPVLPPDAYGEGDLGFIVSRVLELTYTAHDLKPWAEALGFDGPPFGFDPDRRALLRAELDAYYARLYGLSREDLQYILDPASVMGADYPSETFRVLKQNEEREFGEYRTQRLVLEAWDRLSHGDLH